MQWGHGSVHSSALWGLLGLCEESELPCTCILWYCRENWIYQMRMTYWYFTAVNCKCLSEAPPAHLLRLSITSRNRVVSPLWKASNVLSRHPLLTFKVWDLIQGFMVWFGVWPAHILCCTCPYLKRQLANVIRTSVFFFLHSFDFFWVALLLCL